MLQRTGLISCRRGNAIFAAAAKKHAAQVRKRSDAIPVSTQATKDGFWYLTKGRALRAPIVPPMFVNKGKRIVSLSQVCRWMAERLEALGGVDIFAGFAADHLLYEGTRVVGVQTRDQGVDKSGKPKPNYEPGYDIRAKVTIIGDGVRGNLTKEIVARLALQGANPQSYATGVKEIWRVSAETHAEGTVIHTVGWPLDASQFGGGWIYHLPDRLVSVGHVVGLDAADPLLDPHRKFQEFKTHPAVRAVLEGGELVEYGAKAIPEGGWYSIPRLTVDGALLVGDAAGLLNGQKLKGIHLAMKSGMLAAETATHERSLYRVLRSLAGAGVFAEVQPQTFGLTPVARKRPTTFPSCVTPTSASTRTIACRRSDWVSPPTSERIDWARFSLPPSLSSLRIKRSMLAFKNWPSSAFALAPMFSFSIARYTSRGVGANAFKPTTLISASRWSNDALSKFIFW